MMAPIHVGMLRSTWATRTRSLPSLKQSRQWALKSLNCIHVTCTSACTPVTSTDACLSQQNFQHVPFSLNPIRDVCRQLLNLRAVMLLDVFKRAHVSARRKVYRNPFTAEPTAAADAVQIIFNVLGQVIVDHQRNLLYIDTA